MHIFEKQFFFIADANFKRGTKLHFSVCNSKKVIKNIKKMNVMPYFPEVHFPSKNKKKYNKQKTKIIIIPYMSSMQGLLIYIMSLFHKVL